MLDFQLRILKRVINARLARGEKVEEILKDYPLLTDKEKATLTENAL